VEEGGSRERGAEKGKVPIVYVGVIFKNGESERKEEEKEKRYEGGAVGGPHDVVMFEVEPRTPGMGGR
jgi:uncharacterized spore protein YtfJ